MSKGMTTMEWMRPARGADAAGADLDDPDLRAKVFRERGRDLRSSHQADVAKAIARELEKAFREGLEAGRRGVEAKPRTQPGAKRAGKTLTALDLTPRPRAAMVTFGVFTGQGERPLVLQFFEGNPIFPNKWTIVNPEASRREFGESTLAQLFRLGLLVPYAGSDKLLTLSLRGAELLRAGRVAADHDDAPKWAPRTPVAG